MFNCLCTDSLTSEYSRIWGKTSSGCQDSFQHLWTRCAEVSGGDRSDEEVLSSKHSQFAGSELSLQWGCSTHDTGVHAIWWPAGVPSETQVIIHSAWYINYQQHLTVIINILRPEPVNDESEGLLTIHHFSRFARDVSNAIYRYNCMFLFVQNRSHVDYTFSKTTNMFIVMWLQETASVWYFFTCCSEIARKSPIDLMQPP